MKAYDCNQCIDIWSSYLEFNERSLRCHYAINLCIESKAKYYFACSFFSRCRCSADGGQSPKGSPSSYTCALESLVSDAVQHGAAVVAESRRQVSPDLPLVRSRHRLPEPRENKKTNFIEGWLFPACKRLDSISSISSKSLVLLVRRKMADTRSTLR